MKIPAFLTLSFSLLVTSLSFAQTNNLTHKRHEQHHNQPHPRAINEVRFHTSRQGAALELPAEEEAFTFGVFGDRTGGPATGVSILADAVHDVNLFEPDLVMTIGDLVQGYNQTPKWVEEMKEYKGIMKELLCPWFPVAGNHDVGWGGKNMPVGQHDANFEMHFGPLWYAFEHKNSWFIALYSDEGNPETGKKSYHDPECQRMSPKQFSWLGEILEKAKDADHVFLFLHHPRWIGGGYGDDWDRVHQMLVDAGNVSAVFAGHIHRMRSDPKDGIEYLALATTGGAQGGHAPEAGWLHHYNMVTVRKNQIAISTIPVGDVLDPRQITAKVSKDSQLLAQAGCLLQKPLVFAEDQSVDQVVPVVFTNPTDQEIEVTMVPDSGDSRWIFSPDHVHQIVPPNKELKVEYKVRRASEVLDETFRLPQILMNIDYLTGDFRYPIPQRSILFNLDLASMVIPTAKDDLVLELGGNGSVLRMKSGKLKLPDGPMTLESWFKAGSFEGRTGLITKAESSEYGLFVSNGQPTFSIHLDGKYVDVKGEENSLEAGQLYHIAGVYDGKEVRLYLDGKLLGTKPGLGKRKTNGLDLIIGGDVGKWNGVNATLDGQIHSVGLSKVARYSGETFTPSKDLNADENALFITDFQTRIMDWVINEVGQVNYATLEGGARLVPLQ